MSDKQPPSPSFWPGDLPSGEPGYTDREATGPIGAGTPHARMGWFWERMQDQRDLIETLTGWSPVSSSYRFEAAIADAFDTLAESYELLQRIRKEIADAEVKDSDAHRRPTPRAPGRGPKDEGS